MNATYKLDGNDSDLKKHVGHRVEVTGTLDSTSAGNRPSTTTGTPTTGAPMSGHDANAPRVRVSSIRMLSAECPAK